MAWEISIEDQVKTLMYGAEYGDPKILTNMTAELTQRMKEAKKDGRVLRVYCGYDPTGPDIHLGHTITLRKLRQFQDFGHEVTFLIGTFTALVGDTSDRTSGRPRKSLEEVKAAADTYADQCFKVLDRDKTLVRYNGDWLADLNLADVIEISSNFTVQQFLARDNYRKRIDAGNPVGLHEFLYALLQGYDAVHMKTDVQMGATDQLFNILAGRKLQEANGQKPLIGITFPILVGTDGTLRMSKSTGNYVGISELPEDQYGKTMSISDETMLQWVRYVTRWPVEKIDEFAKQVKSGAVHPMEAKKRLAWEVVETYYGAEAAQKAADHFTTLHQKRENPDDMPEVTVSAGTLVVDFIVDKQAAPSKGKAKRLIDGKGVKVDDVAVTGYDATIDADCILKVGKRKLFRVTVG
jgi:tyrosyl-tRNA synthetase